VIRFSNFLIIKKLFRFRSEGLFIFDEKDISKRFYSYYDKKYRFITEPRINFNDSEKIPDLAIYDSLTFTPENDEITITKIPLAAIEILSPKQHLTDLIRKAYLYFESGIKSY
jgi:Uma2 family endonuclease